MNVIFTAMFCLSDDEPNRDINDEPEEPPNDAGNEGPDHAESDNPQDSEEEEAGLGLGDSETEDSDQDADNGILPHLCIPIKFVIGDMLFSHIQALYGVKGWLVGKILP